MVKKGRILCRTEVDFVNVHVGDFILTKLDNEQVFPAVVRGSLWMHC